jgi:membrane protease subunit (stomatin/prohibitin family)
MGLISRQLLKVIDYVNDKHDTIVYKFPMNDRAEIMNGSSLTVRDGQVAIFMKDGRIADVFQPNRYTLHTANLPILTSIMSWAKGFNSPFKCDVYFVDTTIFAGQKWGTTNPFTIRDKDFGMIRLRGHGQYAYRVVDAKLFMQTFAGNKREFTTANVAEHTRGIILSELTGIIASSGLSAIDMSASLIKLNEVAHKELTDNFEAIGLKLVTFVIESITFPEEVEKAIDQSSSLGILGGQMGVYTAKAKADALKDAANNQGMAGTMFGMGVLGGLGNNMFGGGVGATAGGNGAVGGAVATGNNGGASGSGKKFCMECGASLNPNAKFCPECGTKL